MYHFLRMIITIPVATTVAYVVLRSITWRGVVCFLVLWGVLFLILQHLAS